MMKLPISTLNNGTLADFVGAASIEEEIKMRHTIELGSKPFFC